MNEQEKYDWMVYVNCMTYNHVPYIVDTMNGFTMQETNFPFVCAVVDDASTDGEPEVIRKYLLENFDLEDKSVVRNEETDDYVLCFAQHKTNKNCYFAVLWLKYNHYSIKKTKRPYLAEWDNNSKYIALCEGDDYWIDPLKLQKQVDFLDNNPEYILVHTNFAYKYDEDNYLRHNGSGKYQIKDGIVTSDLIGGCWVKTLTVCYRRAYKAIEKQYPDGMFVGDLWLFFQLSLNGKFHFMEEETGVYRILRNSACHSTLENKRWPFCESLRKLDYFMIEYVNADMKIRQKIDKRWFVNGFKHSLLAGDYKYYQSLKYDKQILLPPIHTIVVGYHLCRVRAVFHVLSYLLKLKNRIRQKLIRIRLLKCCRLGGKTEMQH